MTGKLKVAVIREELVALTGEAISAVILNQMLCHLEYNKNVDQYIAEEKARDPDTKINPTHGWIYKTAKELCGEIMLDVSVSGVSRRLVVLVERGWLQRRENPYHKWDHTWQYRVDVYQIQCDLEKLGYALEGYPLLKQLAHDKCNARYATSIVQGAQSGVRDAQTIPESTAESTKLSQDPLALTADDASASAAKQEPIKEPKAKRNGASRSVTGSNDVTTKERPRDLLFDAIAEVCQLDPTVKTNGAQIGRAKRELTGADPPYNETHVRNFGKWWLSDDWRKRNTPIPSVPQLLQKIAQGAHYTNGDARAAPGLSQDTPGQIRLRELRAKQKDRVWEA